MALDVAAGVTAAQVERACRRYVDVESVADYYVAFMKQGELESQDDSGNGKAVSVPLMMSVNGFEIKFVARKRRSRKIGYAG